jgi:hypothetical protein
MADPLQSNESASPAVSESAQPASPSADGGEVSSRASVLDWLVPDVSAQATPEVAYPPGLHAAELLTKDNKRAHVRLTQEPSPRWVPIADFVDNALLEHARTTRQFVLVESDGRGHLSVVGMLQTQLPQVTRLTGRTIELEATESLTLRSGRAGVRLRSDGDVEVVGSRISAASRGLLRLVGRALRLN